ncbi:MAG: AIR synthase-related protein, partial [Dehalococcoidales bacterium]|nr:AIR synthase-related protein [Dehalococcoidales bacterium]
LTRSAAGVGDKIAVSGYLGGATAGLEMLTRKVKLSQEDSNILRKAFLKPTPRVTEGQILLRQGVKAAIDISDGLMADLGHICRASKVGTRVEAELVPVHPIVKANFREKALEMALAGGEDYELLFTASYDIINKVEKAVSCPITVIGEVTADDTGKITLVDNQGKTIKQARTGWQHFKTGN